MPSQRYDSVAEYAKIDTPLPGTGFGEVLFLFVAFGIGGAFAGLGLSPFLARTLADVPMIVAACYGLGQITGVIFGIAWVLAARGFVKKMYAGLAPDPEPEPKSPTAGYNQPYQNSGIRIVPVYRNELPPPQEEDNKAWEPTADDIREFVMGWRARGGHQQAKWNGFRLASGITITPRKWQRLCKPLRDVGILNAVEERITGDVQLTPEEIVERLNL